MKTVESSPDVMGGIPVFTGTRVPVETLMDYLDAGDSINEFLGDFPTVSKDQVVELLEMIKSGLIGMAEV